MADTKISALPASTTPLAGTEVLPIVQSSATKQVSVANLTVGRSVSVADLTVATNNVVFSTAAKGANFTANTPATGMTSQLLNWYEEGTWTPTFSSTGFTVGYGSQAGQYVRVGSIVTASMYVSVLSTSGTLTNDLSISGLPFASNATNYGSSGVFGVDQFSTYRPSAFMDASQSKINIYRAGTVTSLTGAELAVGFYLLTISYRV